MVALRTLLSSLAIGGVTIALLGCAGGGGGGAGGATVVGRVLQVETGGPPNPQASVQAGTNSSLTSASDGSFQVPAPNGTTTLTVDTLTVSSGVWIFTFQPASGVTDVGDLWVGPERVIVHGTVRDVTTNNPIPNAPVSFAGRQTTTNAQGEFSLLEVAYSSQTQTAFWGIVGIVRSPPLPAIQYFKTDFSTQPNIAVSGVVEVGDILLTPLSSNIPPGPPFNIWGIVTATGGPAGATVRLKQGGVDVRVFPVGADGKYLFFVNPGSYTISASKGAQTAPDQDVTLTQPNEVIRRDFNLQ